MSAEWLDFARCWRWRARRTLDLGLHIVDGVRRLHLKGDGLAREGLDENLHGGLVLSVNGAVLFEG